MKPILTLAAFNTCLVLRTLLETDAWHPRLVNGSDYPLPNVIPLISLGKLGRRGFLRKIQAQILE